MISKRGKPPVKTVPIADETLNSMSEVSPFFSAEYKGLVNKTAIIYCVYAAIESAYGCAFW